MTLPITVVTLDGRCARLRMLFACRHLSEWGALDRTSLHRECVNLVIQIRAGRILGYDNGKRLQLRSEPNWSNAFVRRVLRSLWNGRRS